MSLYQLGLRSPGVLGAVFGAQGCFLLANAVYTIAYPRAASSLPDSPLGGIPDATVQTIGITSLSLGTIFAIATYQRNLPIMLASLPGRFVAAFIFYRNGGAWRQVAVFEASMGLITGAALLWDQYV